MTYKVRTILTVLLMALFTTATADNYTYLTVSEQGTETSFEVNSISKITFDTTNMTLHLTNGTTQQLPLAKLSKMFFSNNGAAGITNLRTDEAQLSMEGGVLKVKTKAPAHLIIYNIDGSVVKSMETHAGETEVNVGDLSKGIYIIKVNGKAMKVQAKP